MKLADFYYNVDRENKTILISGDYNGGTWRISYEHNKFSGIYIIHKMPTHLRGFLYVGESTGIIEALKIIEELNN